jgi:hypothetical protein
MAITQALVDAMTSTNVMKIRMTAATLLNASTRRADTSASAERDTLGMASTATSLVMLKILMNVRMAEIIHKVTDATTKQIARTHTDHTDAFVILDMKEMDFSVNQHLIT